MKYSPVLQTQICEPEALSDATTLQGSWHLQIKFGKENVDLHVRLTEAVPNCKSCFWFSFLFQMTLLTQEDPIYLRGAFSSTRRPATIQWPSSKERWLSAVCVNTEKTDLMLPFRSTKDITAHQPQHAHLLMFKGKQKLTNCCEFKQVKIYSVPQKPLACCLCSPTNTPTEGSCKKVTLACTFFVACGTLGGALVPQPLHSYFVTIKSEQCAHMLRLNCICLTLRRQNFICTVKN